MTVKSCITLVTSTYAAENKQTNKQTNKNAWWQFGEQPTYLSSVLVWLPASPGRLASHGGCFFLPLPWGGQRTWLMHQYPHPHPNVNPCTPPSIVHGLCICTAAAREWVLAASLPSFCPVWKQRASLHRLIKRPCFFCICLSLFCFSVLGRLFSFWVIYPIIYLLIYFIEVRFLLINSVLWKTYFPKLYWIREQLGVYVLKVNKMH